MDYTGPQGDQGPQGAQGSQGATGRRGIYGSVGPAGRDGLRGILGARGASVEGPQGAVGPEGPQGDVGPRGLGAQGATGAEGVQGVQGVQGTQGVQGVQGAAGAGAPTTAAAATVAAGSGAGKSTWLVLAANSSDITGLSLTTVMAITAMPAGRYYFKCQLIYQASATTTGMGVAVNITSGTVSQFLAEVRMSGSSATATTHDAFGNATTAAGSAYSSQGSRTLNALIGSVSISVDAANTDELVTIEGFFVVSGAVGDLQIKLEAESAGLVVRAMQGSFLELKQLS